MKRFLWLAAALCCGAMSASYSIVAANPEGDSANVVFVLTPCSRVGQPATGSFVGMHHDPSGAVIKDVPVEGSAHPTMTVNLRMGGYTADIDYGNCRAHVMFGVLARHDRTIRVALSPSAPSYGKSHTGDEAYVYVPPTGFIAGKALPRVSVSLRSSSGREYVPALDNGAFYFDKIPAGSYDLIVTGSTGKKVRRIEIPNNFELRVVSIQR